MSKTKKLIFLLILLASMIFYVGWVFYISEPTYVDNAQVYGQEFPAAGETAKYPLHTYDYVVVPKKVQYSTDEYNDVNPGLVLQVDGKHALVKIHKDYYHDEYADLILDHSHYRIIGRGTIYHKVNHYIGFNIMMITQFIIGILIAVLGMTTGRLLASVFKDYFDE